MDRQLIAGTSPFEPIVGYSRAVRVGTHVYVSGTTATDAEGRIVGQGDHGAQARQCLANIGAALERAGARLADVVRTRIYVTDIGQWEAVGKAHAECFAAVRPACTMVEVVRLAAPEMLVEIEVDAVIGSGRAHHGRARATASAGNGDGDGGAVKAIPQARPRGPRPARPRPRTKAQRRAR